MPHHVHLQTDRLTIRLMHKSDAFRLAEYYTENSDFLRPWEPRRDQSQYTVAGWKITLPLLMELHKQGSHFSFLFLDQRDTEICGIANFSNIIRGAFHACYLGYSVAQKWQGKGIMFEGLQATLRYMLRQQNMHRIMANYMPHNHRSGRLLSRLGFLREGYARNYLLIDGKWQDHILTALTNPEWRSQ